MKIKESKKKVATFTKSELLAIAAVRLKDRVLFPKKVEESKKIIDSIIQSAL